MNGGGSGMITMAGKYAGKVFLKRHKLVVNYCAVAAMKVAKDYASASMENLIVLLFTIVVDCVLIANGM